MRHHHRPRYFAKRVKTLFLEWRTLTQTNRATKERVVTHWRTLQPAAPFYRQWRLHALQTYVDTYLLHTHIHHLVGGFWIVNLRRVFDLFLERDSSMRRETKRCLADYINVLSGNTASDIANYRKRIERQKPLTTIARLSRHYRCKSMLVIGCSMHKAVGHFADATISLTHRISGKLEGSLMEVVRGFVVKEGRAIEEVRKLGYAREVVQIPGNSWLEIVVASDIPLKKIDFVATIMKGAEIDLYNSMHT